MMTALLTTAATAQIASRYVAINALIFAQAVFACQWESSYCLRDKCQMHVPSQQAKRIRQAKRHAKTFSFPPRENTRRFPRHPG
jgi:hypothetical protein